MLIISQNSRFPGAECGVYYHDGAKALKYAHYRNGIWKISELVVGLTGDTYLAMDVDTSGRVHIAFYDSGEKKLTYCYLENQIWHFETVEDDGDGRGVSLAVDGKSVPHLSYRCGGACYAVRDKAGWRIEQIVTDGNEDSRTNSYRDPLATSIALDVEDRPHIAFDIASYDYHLGYAVRVDDKWNVEHVFESAEDSLGWWSGTASHTLVLDSLGTPHISFVVDLQPPKPGHTFAANYASRNAEGWHTKEIAYRSVPTLAWSQQDGPTIVYTDGMKLNHARRPSTDWVSEVIDRGGEAGRYAKLATNTNGQIQIVSYDSPNGSARSAEWR